MRVLLIYISAMLRPYGSSRRLRAVPQFCLCASVCPYTVRVSSVGTEFIHLCVCVWDVRSTQEVSAALNF